MPKRSDIHSVLVIGSGPIVIGQACEFDYSGNQALRALRQEGCRTILVNSNPATIMTDPDSADVVYIEPLTVPFLEKILEKERPDAILSTMGGQTALNLAVRLEEKGILKKYGVELLGANAEVIKRAENRSEFRKIMLDAGISVPKSWLVHSLEEAESLLTEDTFPLILRPSFTLGGEGGGVVYDKKSCFLALEKALKISPVSEVLVEESLIGWKEYELEVVRDSKDNVIIVCSIENLDPMGVHTGDSITVAPAQTLTDGEYQRLRDLAITVVRLIGVNTGGANVQFAVDPKTDRYVVIEINPRVSRSSALASKATGFPIAKVAARLALGYTLDELTNDITKITPASFEPTMDYVVVKIPRFDFEKFQKATPFLNTTMRSIGEVMAMGSTFKEAFLKALSGLETDQTYLMPTKFDEDPSATDTELLEFLSRSHHRRVFYLASAIRRSIPLKTLQDVTGVDLWFLSQFSEIIAMEKGLKELKTLDVFRTDPGLLARVKSYGFSDHALSHILGVEEADIRTLRHKLNVRPQYLPVDTCAAEFEAFTPYLYSTYGNWQEPGSAHSTAVEYPPVSEKQEKTVIILGGGPNRIGQGIEFDYCCVHASLSLQEAGYHVVMVNCNPETVSTDFDISNRLYFEPLTAESVLEIAYMENPKGVVVQFGGQTPLNIARTLEQEGVTILGTSVDSIDSAEDRDRCQDLARNFGLKIPENGTVSSIREALVLAKRIGFPVLVRPSYVLGGRAMHVLYSESSLETLAQEAFTISRGSPLFIDRFLNNATEVDVDVLCDGTTAVVGAVMEHIEKAGIHSGDSFCAIPPFSLSPQMSERIRGAARELAFAFQVKGLMNVQLAVQGEDIYLIEVNPRASRTVPFASKAIGVPMAKIAAQLLLGKPLSSFQLPAALDETPALYSVKGPIFPFDRFDATDPILGPEMRSTGEVMGRDTSFGSAFVKSLLASNVIIPSSGNVFLSVRNEDKDALLGVARELSSRGFSIFATYGTHFFLKDHGIESSHILKLQEGSPNCVEEIRANRYALVINTTSDEKAVQDSYTIRRSALETKTPCFTTISAAIAMLKALEANEEEMKVSAL